MLNDLYFKITGNIRPYFLGPMGGLKTEGPMYIHVAVFVCTQVVWSELREILADLAHRVSG